MKYAIGIDWKTKALFVEQYQDLDVLPLLGEIESEREAFRIIEELREEIIDIFEEKRQKRDTLSKK
jgi:hypothetical protein